MENRCCSQRYFNGSSICADRYNHAVNTNDQTMDWTENDECLQNWTFVCFNAFFLHTNRMRTDHWHIASNNNYFGCCRVYEAAVTTISCVRQYVSLRRQYKTVCAIIVEQLNIDCVTRVSTGRLFWWTKRIAHRNTTQPNKTQNIYKCTGFYCLYTENIWYYIICLLYLVHFIQFVFRTERKFWI